MNFQNDMRVLQAPNLQNLGAQGRPKKKKKKKVFPIDQPAENHQETNLAKSPPPIWVGHDYLP